MSTDYTPPKVNVPEPVHVNTALVALTDVVRPREDHEGARDLGMIYKRCLQFVGAWEAHLADDETSGSAHDPREGRQFMDCRDCATYGKHTRIPGCVFYEQDQLAADEYAERPLFICSNLSGATPPAMSCPDCGHRAGAHTNGHSCDVCAVIRAVVMIVQGSR